MKTRPEMLVDLLWCAGAGGGRGEMWAMMSAVEQMDSSGFLSAEQAANICADAARFGEIDPEGMCASLFWEDFTKAPGSKPYRVKHWVLADPKPSGGQSFVSFAQAGPGGAVKIGCSGDVAARIAALQTGNAAPLRLLAVIPGGRTMEYTLHDRFSHCRVSGEWFRVEAGLRALIEELGGKVA